MDARLRSVAFGLALAACGCAESGDLAPVEPKPRESAQTDDPAPSDPRVDPSRCSGEELDLVGLIGTGLCNVPDELARPLTPEQLQLQAPARLRVSPGERLEFALTLVNPGSEAVDVDLRFGQFLPLAPEDTVRVGSEAAGNGTPATGCTLQAMSTEPPPERITLPPGAELAIPAQWYANTRLVDPLSYVGSECPDFPPLARGRYRSRFVVPGAAGSTLAVDVEIEVREPKR